MDLQDFDSAIAEERSIQRRCADVVLRRLRFPLRRSLAILDLYVYIYIIYPCYNWPCSMMTMPTFRQDNEHMPLCLQSPAVRCVRPCGPCAECSGVPSKAPAEITEAVKWKRFVRGSCQTSIVAMFLLDSFYIIESLYICIYQAIFSTYIYIYAKDDWHWPAVCA